VEVRSFAAEELGNTSYLLLVPEAGVAVAIDPMRDVAQYLDVVEPMGLGLTWPWRRTSTTTSSQALASSAPRSERPSSRLGLNVVVGSDGALPLGDRQVVHLDANDLGRSVDRPVSRTGPLHAVVAVDTPMLAVAAAVASSMGLHHNPVEAVTAANNKAAAMHVAGR
jgi:hypothetical protein